MRYFVLGLLSVVVIGCGGKDDGDRKKDEPQLFKGADDAKVRNAHMVSVQFTTAYARWSLDNPSDCPRAMDELVQSMSNKKDTLDPWGRDYEMVCGSAAPPEAEGFGVVSAGPDGKAGTRDDIASWKRP